MLLGGRYAILRFIGYGAFASVYAASDQLTHQTVAIKVMLDQPKSKQLFENEISFLSLINNYEKSETIKLSGVDIISYVP
jgi:serine/threonine protein kinase